MCIVRANGRTGRSVQEKGAPAGADTPLRRTSPTWLRENANDHAAVLRAAFLGLVRRDRLLFAVADHVDLVERHLVLLVKVTLHGFGAFQPELLVVGLVTDVIRVTLDLDVDPLRVGLQL